MRKKVRASSKRDQLIATAVDLFSKHGFHATGIDMISDQAGVTKRTMYNYFRSKDELILAALKHYDGLFRNDFVRQVESLAKTPDQKLLAIFDVAEGWFKQNNFYGCMFINVTGEYSDTDTPIRQVCKEFKQLMGGYIRELCEEAQAHDPAQLAEELALLLEGAIVTAQVSQQPGAAQIAKRAATSLISRALSKDGS